jgi:hypothetical protein
MIDNTPDAVTLVTCPTACCHGVADPMKPHPSTVYATALREVEGGYVSSDVYVSAGHALRSELQRKLDQARRQLAEVTKAGEGLASYVSGHNSNAACLRAWRKATR